jgi:hypothetical protein
VLPERLESPRLHDMLRRSFGLRLVGRHPVRHASPAQLKARITVFRKQA